MARGVSERIVTSGSLALNANSGRLGCVWRRDLKQVTSGQAASLLEQESRGDSLSRLLALPRVWVWLWVRVLGDRRPKGIGWYLAPEVR